MKKYQDMNHSDVSEHHKYTIKGDLIYGNSIALIILTIFLLLLLSLTLIYLAFAHPTLLANTALFLFVLAVFTPTFITLVKLYHFSVREHHKTLAMKSHYATQNLRNHVLDVRPDAVALYDPTRGWSVHPTTVITQNYHITEPPQDSQQETEQAPRWYSHILKEGEQEYA